MRNRKQKVFGIGFHKTGTTSLRNALRMLGYRVTGPNGVDDRRIGQRVLPMAYRLAERYEAFQDNPWPLLFRNMDARYPGSKFILTVRPVEEWIRSVVRHFGTDSKPMREWIYGVGFPRGHEQLYVERYERHNREVREHFQDRPHDLLVLQITRGDGWSKLCPFLNQPVPDADFPHANDASVRNNRLLTMLGLRR